MHHVREHTHVPPRESATPDRQNTYSTYDAYCKSVARSPYSRYFFENKSQNTQFLNAG